MSVGRDDIGFENPILESLCFYVNENYNGSFVDDFNIGMSIHTKRKDESTLDFNEYESTLTLELGGRSTDYPFYCEVKMRGQFYRNVNSDIDVKSFVKFNMAAILYSYVRPIVSDTVSKSGLMPYNLPFMNFVDEDIDTFEV